MIKITNYNAGNIIVKELVDASFDILKGLDDYPFKCMVGNIRKNSLSFQRYYGYDKNDWFINQGKHTNNLIDKWIEQINIDDDIDYLYIEKYKNAVEFKIISDIYGVMGE